MKYRHRDLRNVLERASARETAMRVCLGAICAQFLEALGITTRSYVQPHRRVAAAQLDEWDRTAVEAATCGVRRPTERANDRGDR